MQRLETVITYKDGTEVVKAPFVSKAKIDELLSLGWRLVDFANTIFPQESTVLTQYVLESPITSQMDQSKQAAIQAANNLSTFKTLGVDPTTSQNNTPFDFATLLKAAQSQEAALPTN